MSETLSKSEFKRFQQYIKDKCGIDIPEEKAYLIETRLSHLLAESRLGSYEELYSKIHANTDPQMDDKIIDAITTNETSWFRDKTPWVIISEVILPQLCNDLSNKRISKIRIWSAASSTGQEAYSTAICIREYLEKNNMLYLYHLFEIMGTDISPAVLDISRNGKYDSISIIRGLDNTLRDKYFTKDGNVWGVNPVLKEIVKFSRLNLQGSFAFLGKFDVVFLRYVMIYFSDELKTDIIKKMSGVLNTDGTLFIGASELFSQLEHSFARHSYKDGNFFKGR